MVAKFDISPHMPTGTYQWHKIGELTTIEYQREGVFRCRYADEYPETQPLSIGVCSEIVPRHTSDTVKIYTLRLFLLLTIILSTISSLFSHRSTIFYAVSTCECRSTQVYLSLTLHSQFKLSLRVSDVFEYLEYACSSALSKFEITLTE